MIFIIVSLIIAFFIILIAMISRSNILSVILFVTTLITFIPYLGEMNSHSVFSVISLDNQVTKNCIQNAEETIETNKTEIEKKVISNKTSNIDREKVMFSRSIVVLVINLIIIASLIVIVRSVSHLLP